MLQSLRKPLALFLLVLSGQVLTLLGAAGIEALTAEHLALLTAVAALIVWAWDFTVQRPVSHVPTSREVHVSGKVLVKLDGEVEE